MPCSAYNLPQCSLLSYRHESTSHRQLQKPKSVDSSTEVEYVRSTLINLLLDKGKDVIIATHLYGGAVGGFAVQRLTKTQRAQECKKGVLRSVWIMGLAIAVGSTALDELDGSRDAAFHLFRMYTTKHPMSVALWDKRFTYRELCHLAESSTHSRIYATWIFSL